MVNICIFSKKKQYGSVVKFKWRQSYIPCSIVLSSIFVPVPYPPRKKNTPNTPAVISVYQVIPLNAILVELQVLWFSVFYHWGFSILFQVDLSSVFFFLGREEVYFVIFTWCHSEIHCNGYNSSLIYSSNSVRNFPPKFRFVDSFTNAFYT